MERSVYAVAVDYLSRREYCESELVRKLQLKGFESEAIDAVVLQLKESGLLSHQRFIESFIRRRYAQGIGPIRILRELEALQLEPEYVAQALDDQDVMWDELLRRVWHKKYATKPEIALDKQLRFLLYRGFSSDRIYSFLRDKEVYHE